MITTERSQNGDAPSPPRDSAANGQPQVKENNPMLVNGTTAPENGSHSDNGSCAPNGYALANGQATNGHGKHVKKRQKHRARRTSAPRLIAPTTKAAADPRPALAVFCWEDPDTPVGESVSQTVAALARRKTFVHLFARTRFNLDLPHLRLHPIGDCEGSDLFARVQEFTSRAANAFMHEFPGGSPHVTLIGYEWSGAGPLSLLRGLKNNRAIFSLGSLERQRSDMTAEISKRIDELEQRTLRESQMVLTQEPATAEVAKFWVPECAGRLVAARQPFPVGHFDSKLDPGEVKARYQVGPIDPTILYVGDLSDRYGPDLLVKAMPAILRNHPQARLILVGDGATYWTLRVYSRYLLLDHAIRFPGSIVGQPMAELVAAADLIAVPSRDATPWWPIQAAWAARRPVVATHHAAPGLLEHERDSLLVYPVEQSVVWGVERLLYDADLCEALGEKGRVKLEDRFGWNNVAEQIEELMGVPVRS
jgi:glycosyltransferase involved in cell wall biosynthesis